MKDVNLFGCTTAEKLIILQEAYEEILKLPFVSMSGKGEWKDNVQYEKGDIISYYGSSYICNIPNIGRFPNPNPPSTDPRYWQLLASKGEQGNNGKDGVNGKDGQRGLTGTGISHIIQGTPYISGENTITPLSFEYSDGTSQELSAYAQNGKDGASGAAKYVNITNVPSTAVQGYLTVSDMSILDESPRDNYIMFYGEKFIPMDISNGEGYRVYTHHGETENKQGVSKFIYLNTVLTEGQGYFWVMNVNIDEIYEVNSIPGAPGYNIMESLPTNANIFSIEVTNTVSSTGSFNLNVYMADIGVFRFLRIFGIYNNYCSIEGYKEDIDGTFKYYYSQYIPFGGIKILKTTADPNSAVMSIIYKRT